MEPNRYATAAAFRRALEDWSTELPKRSQLFAITNSDIFGH